MQIHTNTYKHNSHLVKVTRTFSRRCSSSSMICCNIWHQFYPSLRAYQQFHQLIFGDVPSLVSHLFVILYSPYKWIPLALVGWLLTVLNLSFTNNSWMEYKIFIKKLKFNLMKFQPLIWQWSCATYISIKLIFSLAGLCCTCLLASIRHVCGLTKWGIELVIVIIIFYIQGLRDNKGQKRLGGRVKKI